MKGLKEMLLAPTKLNHPRGAEVNMVVPNNLQIKLEHKE